MLLFFFSGREVSVTASRESGELVAELEKPEPSWAVWKEKGGLGGGGRSNNKSLSSLGPFAISRKWVAELKLHHDQVLTHLNRYCYQ